MTRNDEFFSMVCVKSSAVRSVRPVLLKLSTSRRVLISSALKSLQRLQLGFNHAAEEEDEVWEGGANEPAELIVGDVDVVEADLDELAVVVVDLEDRLFRVGGVGWLERQRLGLRRFCDAVPAQSHHLFVEKRCMVLVLVHHRVETQNGCNNNNNNNNNNDIITGYFWLFSEELITG